jgi:RHS repeat-associated protein
MIADANGQGRQFNFYYPYGMPSTNESSNLDKQPYKFGGKEYETMHGLNLYDFEARPYDPILGRFLTPDPLAEKYPWINPYAYCKNNPVNRIDPDGMDDYEVSHNGRVVWVAENKDRDMVYSLNKKGERLNNKEYEYGTINLSSAKEGSDNYYIIQITGDDQAKDLFEFLAAPENFGLKAGQNVEWGRTMTGESGDKGLNFLTTSQGRTSEKAGGYLFDNQLKNGYTIRGHDHNHPTNDPYPSGTGPDAKNGDIPLMIKWKDDGNVIPNAKFRIFTPGLSKKYNTYTESTTRELPEFTVTAKRRKK